MNVTFLLGNGFDLNLGLSTSYKDFYSYYTKKEPNDFIAKSISKNYELWSDLELGLGKFLKIVKEDQINDFLNSKALLEKNLIEYVKYENKKLSNKNEKALAEEVKNQIPNFFKDFNLKEKNCYKDLISKENNEIIYKFINFNYTNALDSIIDIAKKHSDPFSTHKYINYTNPIRDGIDLPLHIHGDLNNDLILGVNDSSQIENSNLNNNSELTDYIIKTKVNENLGELNISKAKTMINGSCYVCIYGLSIGDTDNYWWSYLIEWLLKDTQHRLVLFVYNHTIIQSSAQEKLRCSNSNKNKIISKNYEIDEETKSKIRDRIIVIQNSKIFDFENIDIKNNNS